MPDLIDQKTISFNCKSVTAAGEFEGYASKFGIEDQGGDTVLPGAFTDTLKRRGPGGVKMLAHHDRTNIIGVWKQLVEDSTGLFSKGKLFLDDAEGQKLHTRMKAGALDGLSIGYRINQEQVTNPRTYQRDLIKLDLFEISVVAFPMLESARIDAVKGAAITERELEKLLVRDAGFSRSEARKIISKGYKSLAARDASDGMNELLSAISRTTKMMENGL